MPVTEVKEIRLLPPLAIGRLGSSDEPMSNYDALEPATPAGFRRLVPAETLVIDPQGGAVIGAVVPTEVRFRDGAGRIKPVAPFLEVWARYSANGELEPLTLEALTDLGLTPADVRWEVVVGNLKMFRRTGDRRDRIDARLTPDQLAGHARQEIRGRADNFRPTRTIRLGWAQYVRPTAAFPEVRFRFTPAEGRVYGHIAGGVIPADRAVYDPVAGRWDTHNDGQSVPDPNTPRAALPTDPQGIYARTRPPQPVNLGYLDDSCDGIVRVSLRVGATEHKAFARVSAGPPAFAPDSLPVRSVADDLEQMAHGPDVGDVTAEEVIDIVRRSVETMRLMNTETENQTFPFWIPAAQRAFGPGGARYVATRALHEQFLTAVQGLKAPASDPARATAVAVLELIVRVLREPERTADYSRTGPSGQRPPIQRMPAFLRGSDGNLLALARRQQAILRRAIEQFRPPPASDLTPAGAMKRMIQAFGPMAALHSAVTLPAGGTLADLFATPDQLIQYLADPASVARGPIAAGMGLANQRLVMPRDPANSAFFKMVTDPGHPMNAQFAAHQDAETGDNGIEVARKWILSL